MFPCIWLVLMARFCWGCAVAGLDGLCMKGLYPVGWVCIGAG